MMLDSTITVGDLSAFMLYAAYVGISMSGSEIDLICVIVCLLFSFPLVDFLKF